MSLMPPPPPDKDDEPKISGAVFLTNKLEPDMTGAWKRIITFWYDGEEYLYSLASAPGRPAPQSEIEARSQLFGEIIDNRIQLAFLEDVYLDPTRKH